MSRHVIIVCTMMTSKAKQTLHNVTFQHESHFCSWGLVNECYILIYWCSLKRCQSEQVILFLSTSISNKNTKQWPKDTIPATAVWSHLFYFAFSLKSQQLKGGTHKSLDLRSPCVDVMKFVVSGCTIIEPSLTVNLSFLVADINRILWEIDA